MKDKSSRKGSQKLLRGYWRSAALITGLTMLQSLLQVALAVLMQFVIDAALSANGQLITWGIALIADLILLILIHGLLSWCSGSAIDRYTASLRRELLVSAAHSKDAKLQSYHSGELLNRGMEDVGTVCDGAISAFPALIGQITSLIGAFAAVLMLYPAIAAVLIVAAAVVGGIVTWLRPVIKRRHKRVRESDEHMMAQMQEDLQQLELIQSLQIQDQTIKRFDIRIKDSLVAKFNRRLWSVGSNAAVATVSNIGTGVLLLWGAVQVAAGALSYGSLTSLLQLLSQFRTPVLGLSGLWSRLMAVEVAQERLAELLEPVEEVLPEQEISSVQAVVFENVTFRYPGEETPVISNFSARFSLDGWSCLTGISGKGKTTLFKLILGLYSPQEGRIYLETDDGPVTCSEHTRCLFAYVPQDYALFSGTIEENMRLVAPDASDEQIRRALKIAEADYVWTLSAGDQTQVRENNTGLSKGQIQRLAIARAVLMERPIFLLDECTSALDAVTEAAVLQNLRLISDRAILVTHRPEALENLKGVVPVSMEK